MKQLTLVLLLVAGINVNAANLGCKNQFSGNYWFERYSSAMQVFPQADNPRGLGYAEVTITDHNTNQNLITKPSNGQGYSVRISPTSGDQINGFPMNLEFSDLAFVKLRDRKAGDKLARRGLLWLLGPAQDQKTAIVPILNKANQKALATMGVRDFAIIGEYIGGEASVIIINSRGDSFYGVIERVNPEKSKLPKPRK